MDCARINGTLLHIQGVVYSITHTLDVGCGKPI